MLLQIADVRWVNAAATYDHAQQAFFHGYLKESQEEAGQAYARFFWSDAGWARKFQLLEAQSMEWRRLNDDTLRLLADDRIPWDSTEDQVQRRGLESIALINLHRFPEAIQRLGEGDRLCRVSSLAVCNMITRDHGLLLLESGKMPEASQVLLSGLEVARDRKDGFMEAVFLLNLGNVSSQLEHHDEARDFYSSAYRKAIQLGARDLEQKVWGNEAWEQHGLGNSEKALDLFDKAEKQAAALGDDGSEIDWLTAEAYVYAKLGQLELAEKTDLDAIVRARRIDDQQNIINAAMDLAQDYVDQGKPDEADRYCDLALPMERETNSELDLLNTHLIQGQAAALRHDWPRADSLLREVSAAANSQDSMKWDAERSLGNIYEAQGNAAHADKAYRAALGYVEGARKDIQQEEARLPFLSKATRIYDDYIHFLIANGKTEEALQAADWSRARTLQQGLGLIPPGASTAPPTFHAVEIARKANATLLFYWLGERQSYLWAVSPSGMTLVPLPAKSEIISHIERYRRAVLDLKDPLKDGNRDGRALYETLVAPAAKMVPPGGRVVLFADGELSGLNFETLIVSPGAASPGAASPDPSAPHFWIEDATVLSAPSIRMFAASRPPEKTQGKLLLLGDPISTDLPPLPMASVEVQGIQPQFASVGETVFTRERATPAAYLNSNPEQFAYIHFVTHGTASRTDPLDSAVVLSPEGGSGPYRLRARDILKRPIDAQLVTISACESSGAKSVAGEGLVGVSWAFLRAGAHNAIGALWDVSDASTPELMDRMYGGLNHGEPPADALRSAKLSLLHSGGKFARPFYWAPFQLYAGR